MSSKGRRTMKKSYEANKAAKTEMMLAKRREMRLGRQRSIIDRTQASLIGSYTGFEKKYVDATRTLEVQPDTAGVFEIMNKIQQGNGLANRIGQKITMKSLHLKVRVSPRQVLEPFVANMTEIITFALVYDRNPGGNTGAGQVPALTTIFNGYDDQNNLTNDTTLS